MAEQRKYGAAEAHEILRRAAEKTAARAEAEDGLEHDALVAAAKEAGIDPAAVEQAAREVDASRALEGARRELTAKKRQGFSSHLAGYVIVNVALVLLALLVTGQPYSLVVAIGWGIGLAFHLLSALRAPTDREVDAHLAAQRREHESMARAMAKSEAKRRSREEKERKRAEDNARAEAKLREKNERKEKLRVASEALENAVEAGVAAALEAAASTIESIAKPAAPAPPSTDFARYVDEKKRGASSSAPGQGTIGAPAAPTGVRVDAQPDIAVRAGDDRAIRDERPADGPSAVAQANKRT